MKSSTLIVIVTSLLAALAVATEPQLAKEKVREAILLFRRNPFSPQGRAAGELVRKFAEKSDTVTLQVTEKTAPFLNDLKLLPRDRALFLDAFVIGNVDSQLLRNEKKDDPYSGELEVIQIYQKMKAENPALNISDIEKFIELDKRGELQRYLATP